MAADFSLSVSLSYLKASLTRHKILLYVAEGFTSPPKQVVLRIFIARKNTSVSAGFEHTNVGFSGKHASHYTTEND
jgi:hypothetical protein